MERKVGEIFEYNGEWYQCVDIGFTCADCDIRNNCSNIPIGACSAGLRKDGKQVRFKKLEKVGEPHFIYDKIFKGGKVYVQNFMVYEDFKNHKPICDDYVLYDWHEKIISIEIKQNKEDMEEKKLNLKEFDLEAAKAGKPVCTRDGRKARIICFDLNNKNFPIVAIINCDTEENAYQYDIDGVCDEHDNNLNLMMPPEKKEGYVNIYTNPRVGDRYSSNTIFPSKEEAIQGITKSLGNYINTIKIEWEE